MSARLTDRPPRGQANERGIPASTLNTALSRRRRIPGGPIVRQVNECNGDVTPIAGGRATRDIARRCKYLKHIHVIDRFFKAWYFAVRFAMADSAYARGVAFQSQKPLRLPRHSAVVRVTHWIQALSFFALVVSGSAILLAHTRFYWGETGGEGALPLLSLPLRLHRPNVSGWGRNLHFLSAWICVLNGVVYVLSGLLTDHFSKNLLPTKTLLSWDSITRALSNHLRLKRPTEEESLTYNLLQRLAYVAVVFLFFPVMILTGLAMSPNITSAVPALVIIFGGQQSARTLHFFIANVLVLFLLVHIGMVWLAGFPKRVRAMITGYSAAEKEP